LCSPGSSSLRSLPLHIHAHISPGTHTLAFLCFSLLFSLFLPWQY